ncbi:hypothetical protein JKP88DRAFT_329574 [Tribonema minus]|uniref:Uncharacterized protein n=1 Tax=Tribonema minus TaxID=303371 RepID=A0A835YN44_9STRA|nr:hypothetical protein JKP88DRAFT_329574 [Tribonema minus]
MSSVRGTSARSKACSTDTMHIVEYVNHLWQQSGGDYSALCAAFNAQGFPAKSPSATRGTDWGQRFLRLMYQESTHLWSPKWARQTRGSTFFLNSKGKWEPVKLMMPRGVEVLTGSHIHAGVTETQDVSMRSSARRAFHPDQKHVMRQLLEGGELPPGSHMSSKVDGSMLTVTLFQGRRRTIMEEVIAACGDEFSVLIATLCRDRPYLAVLASQNTLLLSDDLQEYMVTAILGATASGTSLQEAALTCTASEAFAAHSEGFLDALEQFAEEARLPLPVTLALEAVCARRTSEWGRGSLSGLAIAYPSHNLSFLGATTTGPDGAPLYVPHFDLPTAALSTAGIGEPYAWPVRHSLDVEALLSSLNDVVFACCSAADFLERHPPVRGSTAAPATLDYEGLVLLTSTASTSSDAVVYCYSKVKTEAYYKAHKARSEDALYLRELAAVAGSSFPSATVLAAFDDALPARLAACRKRVAASAAPRLFHNLNAGMQGAFLRRFGAGATTAEANPDAVTMLLSGVGAAASRELLVECYAPDFPGVDKVAALPKALRALARSSEAAADVNALLVALVNAA